MLDAHGMDALVQMVKRVALQAVQGRGQPRWGIVESVDPSGPLVRLKLQPEGVLTGWLPIVHPSASGAGTAVSIPTPGDQALTVTDCGEAEHAVVVGFSHSTAAPLPQVPNAPGTGGTPSTTAAPARIGEYIVYAHGSVVRLVEGGDIYLKPGSGFVRIDGTLTVNGSVLATGAVVAGRGGGDEVDLQLHEHPTAAPGGPSPPTPARSPVIGPGSA